MKSLLSKLFKSKEESSIKSSPEEGFTMNEVSETVQAWNDALESGKEIKQLLVISNKSFACNKKGDLIDVEEYSSPNISGYREITVGGVFPAIKTVEDAFDSNLLYIPYFKQEE